jgi:Tfp pilus assembly protein PilX
MNNKGFVLIFSLLVSLVFSLLLSGFYLQNINDNNLARRFADSTRAYWLAEAGVANAYVNFPSGASGTLGGVDYTYNANISPISGNYYTITSVGMVNHLSGQAISRTITTTVKTGNTNPSKFRYGIETTTELEVKGSVSINPSNSWKEYSTLDFSDLFGVTKAQMQAGATHSYTASNFSAPVDGITWVEVPSGVTLNISGNLSGSGVLVINGKVKFSGTVVFDGIIYVIGTLTMTGNVTTTGSVLAESSTTVDTTIQGNVTINYNINEVTDGLNIVASLNKQIVSSKTD